MEPGEYALDRWEEFEERLADLRNQFADSRSIHRFLYRGHGNMKWELRPTLERRFAHHLSWASYARLAYSTMPAVQSLTKHTWNIPTHDELDAWGTEYDQARSSPPGYDYYVYLRHHGFPSPLLDWSRSPYVAAFFAFRDRTSERVAIFVYKESGMGFKIHSSAQPRILHYGPYVNTHPRHVLQQAEYTICSRFEEGTWSYAAYQDVFRLRKADQDLLWKFTLPATERLKVLKHLDDYNLNASSLFSTEEALLETVALREIEFSRQYWS